MKGVVRTAMVLVVAAGAARPVLAREQVIADVVDVMVAASGEAEREAEESVRRALEQMARHVELVRLATDEVAEAGGLRRLDELQQQVRALRTQVIGRTAAAPRLAAGQASPSSRLAGFSVVLVQGEMKEGGPSSAIPASAAKALADLREFLPFKSYQLLDTQWTLGTSRVTSQLRVGERTYELNLVAPPVRGGDVQVSRFQLRRAIDGMVRIDSGDVRAVGDRGPVVEVRRRMVGERPASATAIASSSVTVVDSGEVTAFAGRLGGSLIDTSFTMAVGETVVVGTSKLDGGQSLIVLLTAVGK